MNALNLIVQKISMNLSSIYHKTPQNEIIAKLTEKGLIEDSIIDKIYQDTNIKLPVVPADEYFKIDINFI